MNDPQVVVHVLLGVRGGRTDEASRECLLSEVAALVAQIDERVPTWQAITVVHIEDHPSLLEGAGPSVPEERVASGLPESAWADEERAAGLDYDDFDL